MSDIMFDALKGRTITGIDVSDDEEALRFRFTDEFGPVVWSVDGDCCSHSYWHDGYSLNALRLGTVSAVASLELPDVSDSPAELTQAYGYAITTEKGAATLAFRNESNGYYGGYASLGKDGERYRWREITANDWQQGGPNDPPSRTPEELAAQAAEAKRQQFRTNVSRGLSDCRSQLSTVVPGMSAIHSFAAAEKMLVTVENLQDLPTAEILVLGVYLTRMAEDRLGALQAKAE